MATVLIVDDEPDLVEACRMVLEEEGHTVLSTLSGSDAVALAVVHRPDVVLLDWIIAGIQGDEVMRQIRASSVASVPVVVMSALADGSIRSKAAGADAFLAKPFNVDTLTRAIATFAHRHVAPRAAY